MKWPSMRVASPYISINTLSPFFNATGIIMVLLVVVYIAELISDERTRCRLVDGVRDFVTFVTISTSSALVKLCIYLGCKKVRRKKFRRK